MAAKEEPPANHPFTPASLSVPGYVPNSMSGPELQLIYFGPVLVVFILTFVLFRKDSYGRWLTMGQRLLMCWFAVCAFTHLTLEAAFVLFGKSVAWRQDFFSQMWKEWSLADSRYVIGHAGTLAIEGLTAVLVGPACLLILWMTYFRSPARYAIEVVVSTAQLYGSLAYFLDAHFSEYENIAVHDPFLLVAYFIGCNFPWIIIPTGVIIRGISVIASAQALSDNATGRHTKKGK